MISRSNLRLASFDGGGVRGLSQLEIMGDIIHRLNWDKQQNGLASLLPYEHFDLIGGSGTGGLIAIMFAKLHMTVEEASEEFCTITEEVYKQTDITPKERTERLRACLEDLMNKKGLPLDTKLLDATEGCSCFVVASPRINAGTKTCLRSYPVQTHQASTITIIEAALATCATQPAFGPVAFGLNYRKKEYIGAGLGANNPVREVITEACSLFGGDSTVASLLSVGTGHPGIIILPSDGTEKDLYSVMRETMNNCTEKAQEIKQKIGRSGIYFRFSVDQGMQNDHLSRALDLAWIVTQTEGYLEDQVDQLEAFTKHIQTPINNVTLNQLKSGNVQAVVPANVNLMDIDDSAEGRHEAAILEKLKPANLEWGPSATGCMEETRKDILATIIDWVLDPDAPNIFWLNGHPGVGKSAISVSLVELLGELGRLGSSFFFRREKADSMTPNALWRIVAYDLGRRYPTIRKQLVAELSANEGLSTTSNVNTLFRHIIDDPLINSNVSLVKRSPVIVVDALDECGGISGNYYNHRSNLMGTLRSWSDLPKTFKILVTGRGESDIAQFFSTTSHRHLEILTGSAVDLKSLSDTRKFFEDRFRRITTLYQGVLPPDWPRDWTITELTKKCGGLFIWAETIMDFLTRGDPQEQLKRILEGSRVGGIILMDLECIFPRTERKDPLPVSSLGYLCSVSPSMMRYIFNGLQSVLETGHIPRFKHQSLVDFLIDPKQYPFAFTIDLQMKRREITLACFQIMGRHLQFNICKLQSSYARNNDIPDLNWRIEEHIKPHLIYSSCFWARHLSEILFDVEVLHYIQEFMQKQFLFWLEILSMIKKVNLGSGIVQLLIDWLQKARHDDTMAVDMKRFLAAFGNTISQSAPHIYPSALPFSPRNSHVWKAYNVHYPQIIGIENGGQIDWPAIQNILVGHTNRINSVAFSPDGDRIISASDETIIVWDTETGRVISGPFIEKTGGITSIAVSPGGNWIVSGSKDLMIRVWDISTGRVVAGPFEGHTEWVTSVAFSPDGHHIVSGSGDETIRVWDAKTGEMVSGPFKGHINSVTSVTFSPNGKTILSGSFDKTIRMWDVETGEVVVGPLEGHAGAVCSVC